MIPPAALYLPDYITASEQADLLADIDASPWRDDLKRRVQHYGYRYDYKARRVTADSYLGPLPDWLARMAMALADTGLFPARPDQVIVNEYQPGQGIAPHVDCEPCFGDVIASLSLGSGCAMLFSAPDQDTLSHYLDPGSLLVLRGASRFDWTHGIPPRKSDVVGGTSLPRGRRVSLTFRIVIAQR